MSVNKLVLKGTGKMSLHERFTQLSSQIVKQEIKPQPQFTRQSQISRQTSHSTMRSYEYSPSTPRSRTPDQPRYAPRRRSESPVGRMSRPRNQPLRSPYGVSVRPSSTVLAANRIKKKSVYLRLGVRPTMSSGIPVWAEPYTPRQNMGGMRSAQSGLSRSTSMNSLSRWNSQTSLHSFDTPRYQTPRRYGGYGGGAYGRFRGGRRPFNNFGRDGRRRFGRGRFGGGGGNWGRGRGRGRRGGGGGRGRGQGRKQPQPSREELDKELDSYMAGTRGLLDQEMDNYMANK
ncbi:chromatin target of PRMT1 protein isoform X2 [Eurytemora carolleeae]|uniref:chromatin target of PRMT1 protein isoform X2 n=1 Tax=Eurytemora carolleeae TaxID=1294199 RepID=UPI000C75EDD0|nr:chromatin target of PRMT1 protein isoform X2 [Eurytemora carolleeae]|eukprot:XP_023343186.1 chromatin target of PRMT1 protein-like isoform X2 [Eurytemora affinis]